MMEKVRNLDVHLQPLRSHLALVGFGSTLDRVAFHGF